MKKKWLPKAERKTILFLGDDLRIPSGIGTMSKEIVEGTCHRYNWVQLGAAINHPDAGKVLDVSEELENSTGVKDASCIVHPWNGYGDPAILRNLLGHYNPSAILHFTDPRYWIWLYNMEHELRQHIPLFFYTIWDDLPYPYYNENFYRSCDWLGCISKQTYNIVKQVRGRKEKTEPWQLSYVPHGINPDKFHPVDKESEGFKTFRNTVLQGKDYEYVVFYNSRNIRRKMPSDIMLAYQKFVQQLPEEKRDKTCLLMHTQPIDDNGTDLWAVHRDVTPDINLVFTNSRFDHDGINMLYNVADVTINISSNEGFGLSIAESLMAGTPTIVNVTGGLQDQCGFTNDSGDLLDVDDDYVYGWGSNHDGRFREHGEWVIPVYPASRNLVGSPITPYIYDDRCKWEDAGDAIIEWYNRGPEVRQEAGEKGRQFCLNEGGLHSENMCGLFIEGMDTAMKNFTPRPPFILEKI